MSALIFLSFFFCFWSYVAFCTVFLDLCHHKSLVAPAEKRRLVIEGDKQADVHFSLLCCLQYSNALVLRGALPAFNTSCCKWFSVPRCHRLGQKCTCDRCQISGGTRRILDLTSVHQHPEPLPLPPGVKWLGNSWYKPTAGKSTEWERGPTGRCILDGVQSSCNVSPDQQHISWMSTSLNTNCIHSQVKMKDPTAFDGPKMACMGFLYYRQMLFHSACMENGRKKFCLLLLFHWYGVMWSLCMLNLTSFESISRLS